eukprot:CAMPEP_0183334964 /NCGR_PEP_ID=MMETSP0164_2-20130417/3403_1 /TAXON_ID=221442 /ORGANISM="Coccolithus pelagicus ssp braarudi, Strain PLY182g" /LENGTH=487 /DNA_ID=CAMNT_0025504213 /DNA_START=13 /DNA_END=1476 /DNA_ORIENTATION=+
MSDKPSADAKTERSAQSSQQYTIRAGRRTGRTHQLARFRDKVPALETDQEKVSMSSKRTVRAGEPQWLLKTAERTYEGSKEAAGGGFSSATKTEYVLFKLDSQSRVLEVTPIKEWAAYKPAISYTTFTAEEAEAAMSSQDVGGTKAEARLDKLKGKDKKGAVDTAEGGGEGADEGAVSNDVEAAFDFDDGTGGGDGGLCEMDEDGREGLDMEEEDLFDDDDDDAGFEEDDAAAFARTEGAAAAAGEAAKVTHFGVELEDGADEGEEGEADWGKSVKDDLKAEKKRRRDEGELEEEEEEDDDDDEDDEGAELLKRLLQEGPEARQEQADVPSSELTTAAAADAKSMAGEKRKALPDAADDAKRARPGGGPTSRVATPPPTGLGGGAVSSKDGGAVGGSGGASSRAPTPTAGRTGKQKVLEKDVVQLLHEKGKMPLKALIDHFKDLGLLADKEVKAQLLVIIKAIAKLQTTGSERWVILKDDTLVKYGL